MSFFGVNIKKIRSLKKLSQAKFAELFEITRASVGAYEEGRAEAKVDKIAEIARYFGLTLDQLLLKKLTINEILHYDSKTQKANELSDYPQIPFIDCSRIIQYAKNCNNSIFVSRLPKISVPFVSEGEIRAFEVSNSNHFLEGDILLCEPVSSKSNEGVIFLAVFSDKISIFEQKPPVKLKYKELWNVKSVISSNMSKFQIIKQLHEINQHLTN